MPNHIKTLLAFLLPLLLVSCDDEPEGNFTDPGFSRYISAFTSGVVSNQSTIKVVLVQEHPKAVQGEALPSGIFSFDPDIEGTAFWTDGRTIEFRPSAPLPSGGKFEAEFHLEEILDVEPDFEDLEFNFSVITQNVFVSFEGLHAPDPNDLSRQEVHGSVRTADHMAASDLEQLFTATQQGKDLPVTWEHFPEEKRHRFTIQEVVRAKEARKVLLAWTGSPLGLDISGREEFRVPPLGEFSLISATVMEDPSTYISIQFSDPVEEGQELKGMVRLRSGNALRLVAAGNEIKAYPEGQLTAEEILEVDQGLVNTAGNQLQESYSRILHFSVEKPAVRLVGTGVIMPSTDGVLFPFQTVNLKAVNVRIIKIFEDNVGQFLQVNQLDNDYEMKRVGRLVHEETVELVSTDAINYGTWNTFSLKLDQIVNIDPGAIYRVELFFDPNQSLYPCGEADLSMPLERREENYDSGDDLYYYGYYDDWDYGSYNWKDRDNPCKPSYYMSHSRKVSRNILASDIGIVSRGSDGNRFHFALSDLRTAEPMKGVEIELFNYQQQLMATGKSSGKGLVEIQTDGKPFLAVAKKGKQRGYLRIDDGSALSLSLFEVEGQKATRGVKGFLYGERGVWRPGDSIYLSFILEDKEETLPDNHPVILELYDPLGKPAERQVKTKGLNGLYVFRLATVDDAPTGNWQARVKVGNSTFTKNLKIEAVKPNRLKINLKFPGETIGHDEAVAGTMNVKWLHGAKAPHLRATVQMSVGPMKTEIQGWEGYRFDDRSVHFYGGDAASFEGRTDASGNLQVKMDWDAPNDAPGMLKLQFRTQVYEAGGDFSTDVQSVKYSPFSTYAGIKMDGGENWYQALNSQGAHGVSIASVDKDGNPLSKRLEVEVYKLSWNWWYDGEDAEHIGRYSSNKIKSDFVQVSNGKGLYTLTFPGNYYGRMLLRVIDPHSGHSASQVFFVDYPGWRDAGNEGNEAASMLMLMAEGEKYEVGDNVEVDIPSGGVGNIFVTIEKGGKVIDAFWETAEEDRTRISFEATEEMAPNVYVHATLVQPHKQDRNDLPIRMYGVVPVRVEFEGSHLQPEIRMAETLEPEKEFIVEVEEENGRPMTYTLAVVDEGLLDLTRFSTPDPWSHFYAKEALSVKSWDIYRYVMNAETGKMAAMLAVGGDEGLIYKEDQKANRFEPVVKFIGPFHLKKGGEASHTLRMPNYIGSVRVMVVAAYDGAYGSVEKAVPVKKPLMVLATVPRVLGPEENFSLPVNVFAMDGKVKDVEVRLETNEMFNAVGPSVKSVRFTEEGEQVVDFDVKVARKLGIGKIKVIAQSGKFVSTQEVEVDVRIANPRIVQSERQALEKGGSATFSYAAFGVTGTNEATLEVGTLPHLDLDKHLEYLISYPHGCVEQVTSGAFAQLFLERLVKLTDARKVQVRDNVTAGINAIRRFQVSSGALTYWPGNEQHVSEWGTNYAGHFMIEASNNGYDLPIGFLESWKKFQQQAANNWSRNQYDEYGRRGGDLIQAYRLYTLALARAPELGAMNRLKNDARLSTAAAWRLATAYQLVGRNDIAKQMTLDLATEVPEYGPFGPTFGSSLRDQAMILESLTYMNDRNTAFDLVKEIAQKLGSGWHSTQERAYALLAIAKFIGNNKAGTGSSYTVKINGREERISTDLPLSTFEIDRAKFPEGEVTVANGGEGMLFVQLNYSGIPLEGGVEAGESGLGMSVRYEDLAGRAIDPSNLVQGTDFQAVITIKHPGIRDTYTNMALEQIFPSGWQVINTRMYGQDSTSQAFTYQDIRDDRVFTYFDLPKSGTKTFRILLNSTYRGRYFLPAVSCYAMYDETIRAIVPGRWVEVSDREGE